MIVNVNDLDVLLDTMAVRAAATNRRKRPDAWTPGEDAFLRQNLGWLTDDEIGQALGRTGVAVHIRWDRELGLPGPSKAPDVITAQGAAAVLGVDAHAVAFWVDMGLLPGRLMAGKRKIRLIQRVAFRRWVLNPMNWPYFDPSKVTDPELKRMLKKRAQRWGDEWWTTRQVADYHGVTPKDVLRYITKMGKLNSFHLPVSLGGRHVNRAWSYHFILKSEAMRVTFHKMGRGVFDDYRSPFTPAADRWLLKARDELDMTFVAIGRTMKIGTEKYNKKTGSACSNHMISHRYRQLKKKAMDSKSKRRHI